MQPRSVIRVLALAALSASCRAPAPPAVIDPALASCVPPETIALAGVDLDRVRTSPLYAKLPAPVTAYLEPFHAAHTVLMAFSGGELLAIARGTVSGATQTPAGIALLGSPAMIAAGTARHAPAAILAPAETVAAGPPIWLAVRGGAPLPLTGNLGNANNLVRLADYLTLSVRLRDAVDLELTARCPSPDAAIQFEQRLRALISLAGAADRHTSDMLTSLQLRREGATVRATLSAAPDALGRLAP